MSSQTATVAEGVPQQPTYDANGYRTSPDQTTTAWPSCIPYIVGNEACERFSYYGMRAILPLHLASLFIATGLNETAGNARGRFVTHLFYAGVYAFPMIGAILADRLAGKYRTIFWLSLVYCAGHAALALGENQLVGMYIGLALVALGSGGIKPCVSANVGDQFGKGNWFRVQYVYQIFYFSINLGSFSSTLLIPYLYRKFGPSLAFGVPGILMFLATVVFWLGRKQYVHVPPKPGGKVGLMDTCSSILLFLAGGHLFATAYLDLPWWGLLLISLALLGAGLALFVIRQRLLADDGFLAITWVALTRASGSRERGTTAATSAEPEHKLHLSWFWKPAVERFGVKATEGPVAVLKILSIFSMITVFWTLFDQHSTTWVEQAKKMDLRLWEGFAVLPNQVQALNPLFVMLLIPLLNPLYGLIERLGLSVTPLRRIMFGMFLTALSFVAVALLQRWIDKAGEGNVWFLWQVIPFLVLTLGEVMVSATGLEFAYTQAPLRMKSTVMGFWLLVVSLGNVLAAAVFTAFKDQTLEQLFWIFSGLMALASVIFAVCSFFYTQKDYTQK